MGKKKNTETAKREWKDVNEDIKYVCQGGKVMCTYCNPPIANLIVTSTTIMLQDKPWATVEDKDGRVNFNFMGVCMHPSQQRPFYPPPPCKSVISLGEWKDYSETLIDDYNALLVKSTIPCMISGEDLTVSHSGQVAVLSEIEPKMKLEPKIKDVYWKEEGKDEKNYNAFPNYLMTLYIETEDYEPGEIVSLKAIHSNKRRFKHNSEELEISALVNDEGVAIIKDFIIEYE